ncbi:MAG: Smr/MutS family protein [Deltaproteobacteria bacterium]|nr:Smr/MutS family protein [Kofleriaceae bacterium]
MGTRPARKAKRPAVSPEDEALFLQAIDGATPLAGRDRVRPTPQKSAVVVPSVLPPRRTLTLDTDDGRVSGRAEGVNRAQVSALRAGKVRVEATLDLHGDTVSVARPRLEKFLSDAARDRRRCVLVIHGKGLHSDGVAVLRDAVWSALAGELSGLVQAFTIAAPADGGEGATAIMVRP